MKIRVLFFASLRELVGVGRLDLELVSADYTGLQEALMAALEDSAGDGWADELWADNVRLSQNQTLIADVAQLQISDGDELAFLPPVTGG